MALSIPCPACDGRRVVTFNHPNDPSARLDYCLECAGTGEARCAECNALAVDAWIEGRNVTPLCARHFAEHMAEWEI
jgi:hypothetical protein